MPERKILIVEDDDTLLSLLKYNLEKDGYQTLTAGDGLKGLEMARQFKPEMVILDWMLPKMDGLEVCRILRKEMTIPILILTAKTDEIDKILGLEMGADDYITKPFSLRELLARVHAAFRRIDMQQAAAPQPASSSQILKAGEFEIDVARHTAKKTGQALELTPKEFDLLVFLVRNSSQVFSRDILLSRVWGYDFAGDSRTVDVHIRWLREKIEKNPESPEHLMTIRGVGYKFEP
ncbi:MAG TPA: response regulator transcription factor [Dehalococcoidales bacterium]|nr:response regulator transcription factor [Dehalococcoidales bacterium]